MARGPIPYIVQKTNGDAVSGATLTIVIRGAGPATIYANETGGTLAGSPLLTDVDGKVTAWLDEGSYDVTASGPGITTTVRALEVLRGDATMAKSAATAAIDTNTQQIATTAFVVGQASAVLPVSAGTATIGTSLRYARADHVHPSGQAVVTSLPAGFDNQIVYYQTAAMITAGIAPWVFRYRSGSASAYKWEFVGGGPWVAEVTQGEIPGSTGSYVDLATVGPSITVPVAGDYVISWGFSAVSGGASVASGSLSFNGGAPDANQIVTFIAPTSGQNGARSRRYLAIVASSVTKLQYRASAGSTTFSERWLQMLPIRVG